MLLKHIFNNILRHIYIWNGGGVLLYIREDIPCEELKLHRHPHDTEGIFAEDNLRKTEKLIFATYHPSFYFFGEVGKSLDKYSQTYSKFLLIGDFNAEEPEPVLPQLLHDCNAAWNYNTTGIACKKIPCYMRDSACRWFIVENAKIFRSYVKHF